MRFNFTALSLIFILGSYSGAAAISVLPLSERELAKRATVIFTGEVDNVYSDLDQDRETIYTYISVRVMEWLKGSSRGADLITLRQMGGSVGDKTVTLPGAPTYRQGDEILVFAGPFVHTDYYGVLGIFYGKYDIDTDPHTGEKTVNGPSFRAVHIDPETLESLPHRERSDPVFLDDFLQEIRSYLKDIR